MRTTPKPEKTLGETEFGRWLSEAPVNSLMAFIGAGLIVAAAFVHEAGIGFWDYVLVIPGLVLGGTALFRVATGRE